MREVLYEEHALERSRFLDKAHIYQGTFHWPQKTYLITLGLGTQVRQILSIEFSQAFLPMKPPVAS